MMILASWLLLSAASIWLGLYISKCRHDYDSRRQGDNVRLCCRKCRHVLYFKLTRAGKVELDAAPAPWAGGWEHGTCLRRHDKTHCDHWWTYGTCCSCEMEMHCD